MNVQQTIYGLVTLFGLSVLVAISGLIFKAKLQPFFLAQLNSTVANVPVETQVSIAGSYNFIYFSVIVCIFASVFCVFLYWYMLAARKEREERMF